MNKHKRYWIAKKLYQPANPTSAEYFLAYDVPVPGKKDEVEVISIEAYYEQQKTIEALLQLIKDLKKDKT